jgi:Glutaredoxin-like domain (DUF836)
MTSWLVYSRQECSLCDAMLTELAQILSPEAAAQVQVRYVDDDPELEEKYGRRVPVLMADDEFLCAYQLDRDRLAPYL